MSPRVFKEGELVFWFHSYAVVHEDRASIHVGGGSQNDLTDAKIWLEPAVEIARTGRTLTLSQLRRAVRLAESNRTRLLEAWNGHKG